jgi:hypothetical protein
MSERGLKEGLQPSFFWGGMLPCESRYSFGFKIENGSDDDEIIRVRRLGLEDA